LDTFIAEVQALVERIDDEHELTARIAERLSALLAGGYRPPAALTRPSAERHLNYPLYVAPDASWSLACVVWKPGQQTPVHSHETWGVAGILSGVEREVRYLKPAAGDPEPLTALGEKDWSRGQVTVCCTTDDDVHAVTAIGDQPTIGIHVYGGDIGTIRRRSYDPATGAVHWFVSGWDDPLEHRD
jgi:predicted metal-dependent enzyme (double-stranded beta helix superfamily)